MTAPVLLQCPSCASPLTEEHLDLDRGIAKCASCGALMTLPARGAGAPSGGFKPRATVPLPKRVTVVVGSALEIRLRWFTPAIVFLIVFCAFWDGFLLVWYGMALKGGAPLVMVLFPILHVAVGAGLTYFTVASVLNTTVTRVDRGELSVRHGPIPWKGGRTIPRGQADQLWCKHTVKHGKNGPSHTYEVWIRLKDGTSSKLLDTALESEQALYIEQRVEASLGLKDRAVEGEIDR